MERIMIDYGIDLGTTNSAIARMENGFPKIIRGNTNKDILPSCIHIDEKKTVYTGDNAYGMIQMDYQQKLLFPDHELNSFFEFKRTMGTDKKYHCSNLGKDLSSEELSAEVLKRLKSFVKDENVQAAVVTIPARFDAIAIKATYEAAKLAGFEHVELIAEPRAASLAYGLNNPEEEGYWLVFDFGGGTFDIVLMKMRDGIPDQKDSGGDSRLGGKNIDYAIVDEVIIPHLREKYELGKTLSDPVSREIFRNVWKMKAEAAKIALTFDEEHNILTQLFDDFGLDENGKKLRCDVMLTRAALKKIAGPYYQKAIDLTKKVLERNNLKASQLVSLILVGGPTYSPLLREMLREQITEKVDTSLDPMYAVAAGAALFASSIKRKVNQPPVAEHKIAIEIDYRSSTIELEQQINIWIDEQRNKYPAAESFFAEVVRNDQAYTSGKIEIKKNKKGNLQIKLNPKINNDFTIIITDEKGNRIGCDPFRFSVLQGITIRPVSSLSFHIGVEIYDSTKEEDVFQPAEGLEKENTLPATGVINGLKTQQPMRAGHETDYFLVPVYQGDYGAEGTRAIYNNLITNIKITGKTLPGFLAKDEQVDLTIDVDLSGQMKFSARFPALNHTEVLEVLLEEHKEISAAELYAKLSRAKLEAGNYELTSFIAAFTDFENQLKNEEGSYDGKMRILNSFRELLHAMDSEMNKAVWPILERRMQTGLALNEDLLTELKEKLFDAGTARQKSESSRLTMEINEIKMNIEAILAEKDEENKKIARKIIRALSEKSATLSIIVYPAAMLNDLETNFDSMSWKNRQAAKKLLQEGSVYAASYDEERTAAIVFALCNEMKYPEELNQVKLKK